MTRSLVRVQQGLPSDLEAAIDSAVAGKTADLFRRLELASGLPGPRMNLRLAVEVAQNLARRGAKADKLAEQLANLPPNEARGASGKEFLCVCGVLAIAHRTAEHPKDTQLVDRALTVFEERADDLRFRVREAVPLGIATVGAKFGQDLTDRFENAEWMGSYFHAAAVILALADPGWLETFGRDDYYAPINLLHDAFFLAHEAPRSAQRYPGHKALVEALSKVPKEFAKRFGLPMFDRLGIWAEQVKVPEMRDVILANLDDPNLKKRYAEETRYVRKAVEASKKPPRDPTRLIQGMRGRGKKR
jgi:hypothetical protein